MYVKESDFVIGLILMLGLHSCVLFLFGINWGQSSLFLILRAIVFLEYFVSEREGFGINEAVS